MKSNNSVKQKKTSVIFWKETMTNAHRAEAVFMGHLTASEVERKMLFEKHVPKRRIESWQHVTN